MPDYTIDLWKHEKDGWEWRITPKLPHWHTLEHYLNVEQYRNWPVGRPLHPYQESRHSGFLTRRGALRQARRTIKKVTLDQPTDAPVYRETHHY